MNKLFVYGTLKKGYSRNSVLEESKFIGEYITKPNFTMVDLGFFPGLIEVGDTSITGELYEVSDEILEYCDRIEGHPTFYFRKKILLKNNQIVWSYVLDYKTYESKPVIVSGVWNKKLWKSY